MIISIPYGAGVRHFFAASFVSALATSAWAQDASLTGDATQRAGAKLERVEITGRQTDTELRRRAQTAKQVYGREEMDKFGDTNVADVLQRLPGITMQGNAPRMRGLGAGYTLVLINGDPAPPGFALDQLDPAQVERIEVSKGPTASQNAQAVAGAINIILKEAPKRSQRDLRIGLGYRYERPSLGGSLTIGEKWGGISMSLPVSLFQWRGQNDSTALRSAPGLDGLPSGVAQSGDNRFEGYGYNLTPLLNWRISDDETLTWQSFIQRGFWNNTATFSNRVFSGQAALDDDSQNQGGWQNLRSNLQWVNNFSSDDRIEIKAGIQGSRGTYDNQTLRAGLPQRHSVGDNLETGFTQAGNFTHILNAQHSLAVGWDLELRRREEKREITELGLAQIADLEGQPFSARVERSAGYVQDEWQISPQWFTYFGLRGERIATRSEGMSVDVNNISTVITPMWHVNYKLDAAGKDIIRGSITRSYKAPELGTLLARPSVSGLFADLSKTNAELSPDRVGNPLLLPELATGLDLAYEKYLAGGGLFSVGVFYRQVSDLIRNVSSLQPVSYASVPRWVSRPVNFSKAQTAGLELELKGRIGDLLPGLTDPRLPLNLRSALNFYQSEVAALQGPNNRLDGQQPWSGTFGADYRFSGLPINMGASLAFTPDYPTRQSSTQTLDQGRVRSMDVFVQGMLSEKMSARLAINNISPLNAESLTTTLPNYSSYTTRSSRTGIQLGMEIKL